VVVADIGGAGFGSVLDSFDLEAWVWASPVSYRSDAAGSLQFLLGTDESTGSGTESPIYNPENPEYDCALVSMGWDGTALSLIDHWDDDEEVAASTPLWEDSCNFDDAVDGVNGFVGEPVPVSPGALALRRRGETFRFAVSVDGDLTRAYRVRWQGQMAELVAGPDQWRIPAEHSLVVGDFPDSEDVDLAAFHGMQDTTNERAAVFLAYDPRKSALCPSGDCLVSPYDHAIETIPLPVGYQGPVWAPGVAAIYQAGPGTEPFLAYVVPTGAIAPADPAVPGTLVTCGPGDAETSLCVDDAAAPTLMGCDGAQPPRLRIYYKRSTDAAWLSDGIDLGNYCYEVSIDEEGQTVIEPIDVVSSPVVQGWFIYVATNDGRFWEIDTSQSGTGRRTVDYAEGWPRLRKANDGRARSW
jgi:hypothetical protein